MGIGNTKFDEFLNKRRLLGELAIWYNAFDTDTKAFILDLVKNKQLMSGIDGKGEVIGTYSFATEVITKGKKQQGDPYNLLDTGQFYDSIAVLVGEQFLLIEGNRQLDRGENIYEKFGKWITNLTDENLEKLKDVIKENYIKYIKKVLSIG